MVPQLQLNIVGLNACTVYLLKMALRRKGSFGIKLK